MSNDIRTQLKQFFQSLRSLKKSRTNDESTLNKNEILKKLNGTTLMVYFVLLNKKEIGVRALQRNLEFSSPSVARYHLEKLCELKLVKNNNGEYQLTRKADIPMLSTWVLFGKWLLPRSMFIALFFSCFFLGYLLFIYHSWNRDSSIVIFSFGMFLSYLWVDVFTHFKNRPI